MKKISFVKLVGFLNTHYDLVSVTEGDIWNEYAIVAAHLNIEWEHSEDSAIPATNSNIRRLAYGIAPYFFAYTRPKNKEDELKVLQSALFRQIRYFQKVISENCCEEVET